jgi:hypothetical protein
MHRYQQILNVWRIDCRPTPDFQRSVGVGIVRVSASHTEKLRLAFPVSLINVAALRASSRGVAWIDEFNLDSGSLCLVQDKTLQLVKRPAMQTTALSFTSPYPDTDTAQILQSDPASGAFCSTNYLLRNYVVYVASEPLLLAPPATHQTLCGLRAFFLEFAPQADVPSPVVVDGRSGETLAVRRVRNSHETQVNSDPFESLGLFLIGNVHRREQEPFFIPVNQISLAFLKSDQFPVMVSANERDFQSPVERPDARETLIHVPRQDAQIVRDRAMFAKLAANLVVNLVGVGNLGVEPDNDLSRKRELIADSPVKRFVKIVLAELFNLPSQFTEAIACFISHLQSAQESVRLFGRWLKFNLCGQLDGKSLYINT